MISIAQLVEYGRAFDAESKTVLGRQRIERLAAECVQRFWASLPAQFHKVEAAIQMIPPYSQGTLAATNGSTAVTLTGGTWLSSWPNPSRLSLGTEVETYLLTITGPTTGTLDTPFIGTSASGLVYNLNFPCYNLPVDFLHMSGPPSTGAWLVWQQPLPYEDWVNWRTRLGLAGLSFRYAIKDGDGVTEPPQICLYQPPSSGDLCRFVYTRRPPLARQYLGSLSSQGAVNGTITIANGGTTATGVNTQFTQAGWSMANAVLECLGVDNARNAFGLISSVGSDTVLNLSSAWNGPTITAQPFTVSDQVRVPDYCRTALQASMRALVALNRFDAEVLPNVQMYLDQEAAAYRQVAAMASPVIQAIPARGIDGRAQDWGHGLPLSIPSIIKPS